MRLEICIHNYLYERRLCWMLSSILQQKGEKPDIFVSLAYLPGTGNPTSEEVVKLFRDKGLEMVEVKLEDGQEKNRAISRNIRAKESDADWILFADSDHVYDPLFFEDVWMRLKKDKFKEETRVIGADRVSLDISFCLDYFAKDERIYPCEVENVAGLVSDWPVQWVHGKKVAAGNFQLARMDAIKEKGGIYSGRKRDHWRRTKSDRQFRVHMGGRVPMDVKKQYHLNHGRELGIQR